MVRKRKSKIIGILINPMQEMQHKKGVGDPLKDKNKRQRNDIEVPTRQFVSRGPRAKGVASKGTHVDTSRKKETLRNDGQMVYDIGKGARSIFRMEAISGSRYALFHDEEKRNKGNEMEVISQVDGTLQQEDSQSMVPETQIHLEHGSNVEHMA